jgi:anti-anti-sigma factor
MGTAVIAEPYPVRWMGQRTAVVGLPEHMNLSNSAEIHSELLSVINRGASVLIADMTATVSCDHFGADAVARAYQRAVISGTDLRLVVTSQRVRRVLSTGGFDRLVSVDPPCG